MRFGVAYANTGPLSDGATAAACARAVESAGFDSMWTVEHVLVPVGYESTYPYNKSGKMPGGEHVDQHFAGALGHRLGDGAVVRRLVERGDDGGLHEGLRQRQRPRIKFVIRSIIGA